MKFVQSLVIICMVYLLYQTFASQFVAFDFMSSLENGQVITGQRDTIDSFDSLRSMSEMTLFSIMALLFPATWIPKMMGCLSLALFAWALKLALTSCEEERKKWTIWVTALVVLTTDVVMRQLPFASNDAFHESLIFIALCCWLSEPLKEKWGERRCTRLFVFFLFAASGFRITVFILFGMLLLAHDFKRISVKNLLKRQLMLGALITLYFTLQLMLMFFVYGFMSETALKKFASNSVGLILNHSEVKSTWLENMGRVSAIFQQQFGWALVALGVTGLFMACRRQVMWSRYAFVWLLWGFVVHVILISNYEARYYISLSIPLAAGLVYLLMRLPKSYALLLFLGFSVTRSVDVIETLHFLNDRCQQKPLYTDVNEQLDRLDHQGDIYWIGRPYALKVSDHGYYAAGFAANLNHFDHKTLRWQSGRSINKWPHIKTYQDIDWSGFKKWNEGLIDQTMIDHGQDKDLFMVSASRQIYFMYNLPPVAKTMSELESLHPAVKDGETQQFPLVLQRFRRAEIVKNSQGQWRWKQRDIMTAKDDLRLSTKMGVIYQKDNHSEFVWVDRLILWNREGDQIKNDFIE